MEEAYCTRKIPLRRSISSIGFNSTNTNVGIREAKSFTGALEELKHVEKQKRQECKEAEHITKEVSTDKVFVVRHEMLNYRGKQYSMSDIATRWKKDCRMWLWKGNFTKRNKSVSDIKERMQSLRLPSSEAFQRIS